MGGITGHHLTYDQAGEVHASGRLNVSEDLCLSTPTSDILDENGKPLIKHVATVSAVNEVTVTNAATTGAVVIAATGTDSNINLDINPKGTGVVDIGAADDLTVGGVIVPQAIEVSCHIGAAALMIDQTFFVATRAYEVIAASFIHAVAETTAATLHVQVTKDTGTDAPGAGTDLLTNTSNAGFDCKATANTVQAGTLTATGASLQLAAGNRLSVDFSAGATELVGVTITVSLKRI